MKCRLVALAVLIAVLASCETDSYDKGEGKYSLLQADFVDAHSNADKAIDRVVTDDGMTYTLTSQPTANWIVTADSVYRTILYYNKVDTATATPLAISPVTVLNIFQLKDGETMKTDPVTLESVWLSKNGKYLNLGMYMKTGKIEGGLSLQTIGMVSDSLSIHNDGTSTMHLTFYHDRGTTPEYYSSRCYVSIPCTQLVADSVSLTVHTYDGVVTRQLCLPK